MAHNAVEPITLTGLTMQERVTIAEIALRNALTLGQEIPETVVGVAITQIDLRLKDLVVLLDRVGLEVYGEAWHTMRPAIGRSDHNNTY